MIRLLTSIGAAVLLCAVSAMSAQTVPSGNITASVLTPPSVECSSTFTSSLTLTGFDVQDPGVADIVFVLDESGSISLTSFTQMKEFVVDVIETLMTGPGGARVGVTMFGTTARTISSLTDNVASVRNAVNAVSRAGGVTCIECGIKQARQIFNAATARPEATRFMIVLTDGNHNPSSSTFDDTVFAAQNAGITLLAIGVGSGVSASTIHLIASDINGVQTAFFTTDFDELSTIVNSLTASITSPGATNVAVNITVMPKFPLIGASPPPGAGGSASGHNVELTLPSLGSAPRTMTMTHQHDGTGDGSLMVFTATYSDAEGHVVTIPDAFTTVTGCNMAPVANAGVDQFLELSGSNAMSVALNGSASTDDGLISPLTYSWSNSDGSITASGVSPTLSLPFGIYEFTLTVHDGEFTDTDTVLVGVLDPTPPVIGKTVTGTLGDNGWYQDNVDVTFTATDPETGISASTGCGVNTLATDTTGQLFTCTATNGAGESASADETVKRDATPPTLVVSGPVTAEATSAAGAVVTYAAPVPGDATSGVASAGCTPASGSSFGLGTTPVSCSARDNAGNTTDAGFTVTVRDTTPPEIGNVTPSVSSLWPPNHKMVAVTIAASATDTVSAATCHITGASSSEPDNGLGDGDTANDIVITGPLTLQLRAERAGRGPGRTYTIDITCTDASGNGASESTTVTVAHSNR